MEKVFIMKILKVIR